VLFLVALFAGFAQFGAVTSLNDVAKHFGNATSSDSLKSAVGLSGSVLGLGLGLLRIASLASLPLASLADRFGRKKVLRSTMTFGLVATSLASLSPSYWFFVLCFAFARPLLSAASTIVQVITVELASTKSRINHIVIVAAGSGIGAGLSAILHGVIRGPNSFRWLFALGILPIFVLVPFLKSVPESHERDKSHPTARLGAVTKSLRPRLFIVATIAFVIGVISGPANGFAFVYGEGILKFSPSHVAIVVTLSAFTGLGGLLLSRVFAKKYGRRITVAVGVIATALTSTLAYSGGRTNFVIGYLLGVCAAGLMSPAITAMATELFTHSFRATAAGWILVAGVIGAVVGLAVFGWIGDGIHTTAALSLRLPAILTFLPLLPTLLLLRKLPESSQMELR
jgi:MFS family permease